VQYQFENKKAKCLPLAPIVVKTLVNRGSVYKVEAESGTNANKKAYSFCFNLSEYFF
jgi:hypothetical protein